MPLTKPSIEHIALNWFAECGYACVHGPDIAPEMPVSERESYEQLVLLERLRGAVQQINTRLLQKRSST